MSDDINISIDGIEITLCSAKLSGFSTMSAMDHIEVDASDLEDDETGISAMSRFIERLLSNIVCNISNCKILIKNAPDSTETVELGINKIMLHDLSKAGAEVKEKALEVAGVSVDIVDAPAFRCWQDIFLKASISKENFTIECTIPTIESFITTKLLDDVFKIINDCGKTNLKVTDSSFRNSFLGSRAEISELYKSLGPDTRKSIV